MPGTEAFLDTIVLHANWTGGRLHFWGESVGLWARAGAAGAPEGGPSPHPFALDASSIASALESAGEPGLESAEIDLRLPAGACGTRPAPSAKLAHAVGHDASAGDGPGKLVRFRVPTLAVAPDHVGALFDRLTKLNGAERSQRSFGPSIAFFLAAVRLARHLLAQQRFVPALRQEISGELHGLWQPWMSDERTAPRVAALMRAMPPVVRAAVDEFDHQPWPVIEAFLSAVVDAECRATLIRETMHDAIESRDRAADAHVAWLSGLLGDADLVPTRGPGRAEMVKLVRRWISGLEDRGTSSTWRLSLRLGEPDEAALLADFAEINDDITWPLSFHLQSQENPKLMLDASDIWLLPTDSVTIEGHRADQPQDLLLAELGRASRLYPPLEKALDDSEPASIELSTKQAYSFLREVRPILMEQGFGVEAPAWWDQPGARLGARLKLFSDDEPVLAEAGPGIVTPSHTRLGLEALVGYAWEISIGGTTLSLKEFEQLAARRVPLVRVNGQWVEIRPEDVKAAIKFIQENPGGEMRVGDAIRLAYGADLRTGGIPIVGLEATGWISAFFGEGAQNHQIPIVEPPAGFHGSLRPYQLRGLSWLAFLERFGFGPCLADDMGLGKTIQLLALLVHEREAARAAGAATGPGPTLIVVPMSVVGNWLHEAKRFCPELRVMVHHGLERAQGDAFVSAAESADMVVTTYALAHRDRESLQRVRWQRVVLDEAQYIKNPATKQTLAVRSLPANSRIALTGTPVENRLSELWSIIDFLNPGYLGSPATFRKRFSVPIERYHDAARGGQLRALVRPFLLRRLKTDPAVAADLPEKIESREYTHLTSEQAELYESLVKRMLGEVERAEGMQRRGLVLSTLIKLKQVCNHPAQLLKDHDFDSPTPPAAARSGKCIRLIEMLDEVLQSGEQALVFTQFRQMATLLAPMLRHDLDREVLLLHGGTTQSQRDALVRTFQKSDGSAPILIVSLKAGGVGLNLTAATHVFHFDRWWNPAVENQATDRAHRIGQFRTVQVHKFIVRGTLEERIDQMIEQKTELATNIIGSGERWLTELSTDQLRDILTLRREAVGDEA